MESGQNPHFDALKNRYRRVIDALPGEGVRLQGLRLDGAKLVLSAVAPSEQAKNRVWDLIKQANPSWATDLVADIKVEPGAAPAVPGSASASVGASVKAAGPGAGQTYTVEKGDTLSSIAKKFYGDANAYRRIFDANRNLLDDPDKIKAGQVLAIPPKA